MPTDDRQVIVAGLADAPAAWTVPGNGQITPLSIFAHYDGSGAATPFVPAIKVISDGGKTVGIYPYTSSIAAGGSADVSWFPGGRVTATLSNPGLMAVRVNIVGNINIPEGDPGVFVTWGEAPLDTGSPTPFWNSGTPLRLTAPVSGHYLSIGNLEWGLVGAGNAPAYTGHYLYLNGTPSPSYLYEFNTAEPDIGVAYNLNGGSHGIIHLNAGDYLETLAYNFNQGGAARNLIDLRPTENHYASWSLILVAAT